MEVRLPKQRWFLFMVLSQVKRSGVVLRSPAPRRPGDDPLEVYTVLSRSMQFQCYL